MKKSKMLFAGLILVLLLTGCAANKAYDTAEPNQRAYNTSSGGTASEMPEMDMAATETVAEEEKMDMGTGLADTTGVTSAGQTTAQKLIKDVNIQAETKNFDALFENLVNKVSSLGGYIENSQISGNSYQYSQFKSGYLVARIPSEQLDQFVKIVSDNANITNKYESTRDVTLQYVDMESHVKALRAEQESLMKILEAADKLEDIIKIQSQLTQVRYEIESYESQLRTYDNLVTYSTVTINIEEVDRETKVEVKTYGEELASKLSGNLYDIKEGFLSFTIWFISSIPYLIIWAVIIVCGLFIVKKTVKKVKKNNKASLNNKDKKAEEVKVKE